jgi:hypothetical protein
MFVNFLSTQIVNGKSDKLLYDFACPALPWLLQRVIFPCLQLLPTLFVTAYCPALFAGCIAGVPISPLYTVCTPPPRTDF